MRIHFIAIGGAVMHNLAIALHKKGYQVTGSDDEIFEPSKSRLAKIWTPPGRMGLVPEKLDKSVDAVILGMHAREDNPEFKEARKLGLKYIPSPNTSTNRPKRKNVLSSPEVTAKPPSHPW